MPSMCNLHFYRASIYATTILGVVILSVFLSVGHKRALRQNQTMHCRYFDTTRKDNNSSFPTPTVVGGDVFFHLKVALKVTHPLLITPTSTDFPYNVATVRDSKNSSIITNRKSTTVFPTSCRWSAYITPKSPTESLKKRFLCLLNKMQL